LDCEEDGCQLLRRQLKPCGALADLVVLAEDAAQVAAREEDRPRSGPAAQGRLLALVRTEGSDAGEEAGSAEAQMLAAIHAAMPGAQVARFQVAARLDGARVKLARSQQAQIGWLERGHAPMIADLTQAVVYVAVARAQWA